VADPPIDDWLARFQAAQPADHALRLTNIEAQLTTLTVALAASIQKIATLEERMSLSETALADLDQATNEVADELDQLRNEIAGTDAALADRISAAADRLRGLAADPTNPVPADGGDTPADPTV
jgi:septal ring factor EnvC (AmiA/AmiB activator)